MGEYYVYVYLDTRKPGKWEYEGIEFEYQPFYVGKGKGQRIRGHLIPSALSTFSLKINIIEKIIKETGQPPVSRKIYDNLTELEAFDLEIKLIKYFGRIDQKTGILANLTSGGPGSAEKISNVKKKKDPSKVYLKSNMQRVDQFDLNGNFIKKWDALPIIFKTLNLTKSDQNKIRGNIRNAIKSALGFIWRYDGTSAYVKKKDGRGLKVSQFTMSGIFIKTYDSVNDAAFAVNRPATSISRCCRGKRKNCAGFRWKYGSETENLGEIQKSEFYTHPLGNPVYCYSTDGNFIKRFNNLREASNEVNIKVNLIASVCSGRKDSANGFLFFFMDQGQSVEPLITLSNLQTKGVNVYDIRGKLLASYQSLYDAEKFENISVTKLRYSIKYKTSLEGKYYTSFISTKKTTASNKNVYQYSSTGIFLRKYDNLKDAENKTGLSKNRIGPVCQGHEKSYGSFQWFYEYKGEKIPALSANGEKLKRSVHAVDDVGNIILSFDSVTGAMKEGYSPYTSLKDPTKKSSGYFWRYSESVTALEQ